MKRVVTTAVAIMCVAAMFAAPWSKKSKAKKDIAASGYTYGEGKTFRSDKPVTYSISFSDASWYAMQDTWKTEGVFKDIEKVTNVHLDITSYDSGDYNQKINLATTPPPATY